MKRIVKIDHALIQVLKMIMQCDGEKLAQVYNLLSSKDYMEYYSDGICTINDDIEQAN